MTTASLLVALWLPLGAAASSKNTPDLDLQIFGRVVLAGASKAPLERLPNVPRHRLTASPGAGGLMWGLRASYRNVLHLEYRRLGSDISLATEFVPEVGPVGPHVSLEAFVQEVAVGVLPFSDKNVQWGGIVGAGIGTVRDGDGRGPNLVAFSWGLEASMGWSEQLEGPFGFSGGLRAQLMVTHTILADGPGGIQGRGAMHGLAIGLGTGIGVAYFFADR